MLRSSFVALIGSFALAACNVAETTPSPAEPAATATSDADIEGVPDGETVLTVGRTLHIALPSNATTGYQWSVSGVEGSILTPVEPTGQEATDPHPEGMVGVGGQTHWRFKAERAGSATLTFAYARAWERNTPPAETATYRIVVR
jgi:inhibitor of cysteine peptidase